MLLMLLLEGALHTPRLSRSSCCEELKATPNPSSLLPPRVPNPSSWLLALLWCCPELDAKGSENPLPGLWGWDGGGARLPPRLLALLLEVEAKGSLEVPNVANGSLKLVLPPAVAAEEDEDEEEGKGKPNASSVVCWV
jgi:hypothetical protein